MNRSQFWVQSGLGLNAFALNTSRPVFRNNSRLRRAINFAVDRAALRQVSLAQSLKQSVERIGLTIDIEPIPLGAYFDRIGTRSEAFDIAWFPWLPDYIDPYAYINALLDGMLIKAHGNFSYAYFNSSRYNSLMARAAGLRGGARCHAYGKLDLQIARDAAPWVAYMFSKAPTLVSKRVGCIVLRPYLVLAAACLKR